VTTSDEENTRQEKREKKLRKKKDRIKQHGKNLGKIYADAVKKRTEKKKGE
jgi:hypothetical protein